MIRLIRVRQLLDRLTRIGVFLNNKREKNKIIAQINEYLSIIQPVFKLASKSDSLDISDIDGILDTSSDLDTKYTSKLQDIESQISNLENNPTKYDRIAVIFVGHYRTIKLCMPHHVWFFNQMATKVDYYFVTWEMNDYAESDIIKNKLMPLARYDTDLKLNVFGSLLKGHRFVKDLTIPDSNIGSDKNNLGLWKIIRLTYLAKIAQQLKKEYEVDNNFVYDQVIETRPDLFFNPRIDPARHWLYDCLDNQVLTDACTIKPTERLWDSSKDSINQFQGGDWYWRMNSSTYDSFSNRYDFFANFLTNYPSDAGTRETFNSFHTTMASYFLANQQFKFVKDFDFSSAKPVQSVNDVP